MNTQSYIKYSDEQLAKIGNAVVYLSQKIENLSKTKLLKLLYILDEISTKRSGIPIFNIKYKVWKFGPVSEELFIDLSSETTLLKDYIACQNDNGTNIIVPVISFNDDEFSDNDIDLMDYVIDEFGAKTAKQLVEYTHRKNSLWYNTASKYHVLDLLQSEHINNTEIVINLGELVEHDKRKKGIYEDYIENN